MPEEEYRQRRKIEERPLTPPQTNVPSELFEILKKSILDYHPSTDLSLIEKAYKVGFLQDKCRQLLVQHLRLK